MPHDYESELDLLAWAERDQFVYYLTIAYMLTDPAAWPAFRRAVYGGVVAALSLRPAPTSAYPGPLALPRLPAGERVNCDQSRGRSTGDEDARCARWRPCRASRSPEPSRVACRSRHGGSGCRGCDAGQGVLVVAEHQPAVEEAVELLTCRLWQDRTAVACSEVA
jgi:hypothetical protein